MSHLDDPCFSQNQVINLFKMLTDRLDHIEDMIVDLHQFKFNKHYEDMKMLSNFFDDHYHNEIFTKHWKILHTNDPIIRINRIFKFIKPYMDQMINLIHRTISSSQPPDENPPSLYFTPNFMCCVEFLFQNRRSKPSNDMILRQHDFPFGLLEILTRNVTFTTYYFQHFTNYDIVTTFQSGFGARHDDSSENNSTLSVDEFIQNPDEFEYTRIEFKIKQVHKMA